MCECGCQHVPAKWKIIDQHGNAWLFGVYASCRDCIGPAAVMIHRVAPEDFEMFDVRHVPEFETSADGIAFIDIISPKAVRKRMQDAIVGYAPESGVIDDIDAQTLADEAFWDLREAVFATMTETD